MKFKKASDKISSLLDSVINNIDIAKHLIIKRGRKYYAHGQFEIEQCDLLWIVISTQTSLIMTFHSARVALAWCILVKQKKITTYLELERIDNLMGFKQENIERYASRIRDSDNPELISILSSRLSEDIAQRNHLKKQISFLIRMTK